MDLRLKRPLWCCVENRLDDGRGPSEATAVGEERRWWQEWDCVSAGYLLQRAPAWRSNPAYTPLASKHPITGL